MEQPDQEYINVHVTVSVLLSMLFSTGYIPSSEFSTLLFCPRLHAYNTIKHNTQTIINVT